MFALNLQSVLSELLRGSEIPPLARDDMEKRFQSLRGNGRLPQGRENRARLLSDEQIASAILGLTVGAPTWAGHTATVLARRLPVGASANAFAEAPTLIDALTRILSDEEVRHSIVMVRLSSAEAGVNSHGLATIIYEDGVTRRSTDYVAAEAVSLLQPGAEAHFNADARYAPAARELSLNRRFFERLSERIDYYRKHPPRLPDDSPEYDAEEAERARRKKLGATPTSHFLNIGVDNQVTWPREETLIEFDRYKLVLMPKTKENVQSIHIDLHSNRLTMEEGMTVINRFLSLLTWCDDQFAIAQDGWSGNPVPVGVPKRNLAFTTTHCWVFDRAIPTSDDAKRALALYREGRNAEQNYMISYAVLSYFKVLEVRYPEGKDIRPWIARVFPLIQASNDPRSMSKFLAACRNEAVEDYLWKACRVAVAHVREKHPSDPDIAQELSRLHHAADIMRQLARHFIRDELGISDRPFEPVNGS